MITINITQDEADAFRKIARNLATQDNRATDCPIFIVQERRRVYGFDPAYSDKTVWLDSDGDEVDPEEHARLEALHDDAEDIPAERTRTAYQDTWEYVTACFTEAGCRDYIRRNGHNHRGELRIYAAGSWRNDEWRAVRDLLRSLALGVSP